MGGYSADTAEATPGGVEHCAASAPAQVGTLVVPPAQHRIRDVRLPFLTAHVQGRSPVRDEYAVQIRLPSKQHPQARPVLPWPASTAVVVFAPHGRETGGRERRHRRGR